MIENISKYTDYTLLKQDAKTEDIISLCNIAKENLCASVCVNPYYVKVAKGILEGSTLKVCTVVGFPLGANCSEIKANEAKQAILDGATEIDMVMNISALKDKKEDVVKRDIELVLEECKKNNVILKVIIETCLLDQEEKERASRIIVEAGADFVKTSTGFSTKGAEVEDIRLIKKVVGDRALIKASGGIRDYETALAMLEAGASRIGASKLIYKE